MTLIALHHPLASTPTDSPRRFERVHMFPGRHLGEEEFDREQAYADLRLASLLRGRTAGIVQGLELNLGPNGIADGAFSVNAGLALDGKGRGVGLYYPLRAEWDELIDTYLAGSGGADPTGVFYLLLQRATRAVDSLSVDPCQRTEFDPTRDTQQVVTGSLVLQRLNIDSAAVTATPRELIENWVAADRVDAGFMAGLGNAVPLALLAIGPDGSGGFNPLWLSQQAGRYEALPHSGYRVLLNQASVALRRVMQAALSPDNATTPLADFLNTNLHLDFLPAAGQLPLEWLQNPDSVTPNVLWLPQHLGIDMVPVPEEGILELVNRHLARRVIDLRQPAGDKIRLLLVVNEPDYRHDLLDIPQTDARLEQDLYRFYMRAYEAWHKWRRQFDLLYYLEPSDAAPLPDSAEAALEKAVLDPAQFKHLDLPKPEPTPVVPTVFFKDVIDRAKAGLNLDNSANSYPFNRNLPAPPVFYSQWLVEGEPPAVPVPTDDGLLLRYAMGMVDLEAIENQIRAIRSRLEKTRDFLLIMRQQLDSQTVALSSLAGGVAGDGSGLQVARWLPYASLDIDAPKSTSGGTDSSSPGIPGAGTGSFTPIISAGSALNLSMAKSVSGTGLSRSLLKTALTSTSTASRSKLLLASRPQTFSAFELGINKSRLDALSKITKQTVSAPAFEAKEYRFGVIDHISPEINEYAKAYYGMMELLATLMDLFDPTDAASLRAKLLKVGRADGKGESPGSDTPFMRSGRLEPPEYFDNLATREATSNGEVDAKKRALLVSQYRYYALFKAGRILTQWIAVCEGRYNKIERKLQGKLREQTAKIAQLDKLAGLIRVARETLENIDRFRIEQLGDYGVAQRLLEEDWRRVYAVNKERSRILTTALRGLYYVRVRSTPVSASLADPLVLRYGSSRDIVPGCDWDQEVELPDALTPFFTTVCEIPMDDWARLKPLQPKLPPFRHFEFLGQVRQARFRARTVKLPTTTGNVSLQSRLQTVHLQNQVVLQNWSAFTLPAFTSSSLQTQASAAKVLSLEDLALASGTLRKEAQDLKDQLEHAVACLLENLNLLPGSIRLQWGQLAEDDQIRVEDVSWWPGLERAEMDDFNATRTLAELVSWWFRQLASDASANSRSAHHNLIRAVLIHASLGDPQEILRGTVLVPPRLALVGERLQVKLNLAPAPGTRLQLLDPQHKVVAVVAVEDHTPDSTRVNIVDLVQPDIRINTRFTLVSNKRTVSLL